MKGPGVLREKEIQQMTDKYQVKFTVEEVFKKKS